MYRSLEKHRGVPVQFNPQQIGMEPSREVQVMVHQGQGVSVIYSTECLLLLLLYFSDFAIFVILAYLIIAAIGRAF